jgi:DNA-binding MarR family transcriptional regulator
VSVHGQPVRSPRSTTAEGSADLRLGYLLKHVQLRFAQLTSAELAPLGISPREWATLSCLNDERASQREVAELLGVDRTTMVALVDELQAKGLVERRPQPEDRRKNIVTLTRNGRDLMRRGGRLIDSCEQRFLAPLSKSDAAQLKKILATLIATDH